MAAPKALLSSEETLWQTPAKYLEAVRYALGGIELDPASCEEANKVVNAARFFDEEIDGLKQEWEAETVFLNPPYGFLNNDLKMYKEGVDKGKRSSVSVWTTKLLEEFDADRVGAAILLVNNTTEAEWFQNLWDFPICFTDHRIRFDLPEAFNKKPKQPTRGNAFVFLTDDTQWADLFYAAFSQFGHVIMPEWYYVETENDSDTIYEEC